MKRIAKNAALGLALVALLTACFEDPGSETLSTDELDGAFIELQAAYGRNRASYPLPEDDSPIIDSIPVVLNGAGVGQDILIDYTITAGSETTEGVEYNMISSSPLTIPAGEHIAYIVYEIIPDDITPGELEVFENVELTSTTFGRLHPNFKATTYEFTISCPPIIEGLEEPKEYNGVCTIPGFGTFAPGTVTIERVATDIYDISDMAPNVYSGGAIPVTIENICEIVSIESSAGSQWPVGTEGTYDPETGVIVVNWEDTSNEITGSTVYTPL